MNWNDIVNRQTGILNFTPELNQAIKNTKIAVFGTGGNGAVLDFLVRTGYENFLMADFDVVEASNMNRLPFTPDYIGMSKIFAWEKYLKIINPNCSIEAHNIKLSVKDEKLIRDMVTKADIIALNTTDIEANFVIARICARQKKPMIAGPGTANCWVVTTFTHEDGVSLESVGDFNTQNIELKDIDYSNIVKPFMDLYMFPGRKERLQVETLEKVKKEEIAPRSCKMFVSLVNASSCWEIVKNTIVLNNFELKGTSIIKFPILQMFDPFKGAAFYWNAQTKEIGVPDWESGEVEYRAMGTAEQ